MNWAALGDAAIGAGVGSLVTGAGAYVTLGRSLTKTIGEVKKMASDFLKLAQLVDHIENLVISHHTDTKIHRNEDFEERFAALVKSIGEFVKENREDHKAIMSQIANGKK